MGPKVYAAIPVLDEFENLANLIADLEQQTWKNWEAVICINQPEAWWEDPVRLPVCENNRKSMEWLQSYASGRIRVQDKSSRGNGWIGKRHGVGWARKTAMDYAAERASPHDLIVSMDADTRYPPDYFNSLQDAFKRHPSATGLSAPYYHLLTGDAVTDRCILRYEIYMRNYALNLLLTGNPYAFSAIGSGMACKVSDYKRVGGLTPRMSGEDFYFMQKLRKAGNIIIDSGVYVYPAARFSDRVYFGTGPAMIRGRSGDWDSYPVYHRQAFNQVKQTYACFEKLFIADVPTPMDKQFQDAGTAGNFWESLRRNSTSARGFGKACMQRVDALRILQFLKETNTQFPGTNEERLISFLDEILKPGLLTETDTNGLTFATSGTDVLDRIRNRMAEAEMQMQSTKGIV